MAVRLALKVAIEHAKCISYTSTSTPSGEDLACVIRAVRSLDGAITDHHRFEIAGVFFKSSTDFLIFDIITSAQNGETAILCAHTVELACSCFEVPFLTEDERGRCDAELRDVRRLLTDATIVPSQ